MITNNMIFPTKVYDFFNKSMQSYEYWNIINIQSPPKSLTNTYEISNMARGEQ